MRGMRFKELLEAVESLELIQEYLTYDQLYRMSEPKRFVRSHYVRIPPMEVEAYQTANHWVFSYYFNAKSAPGHSTTGLRHRGFVRFLKPKRGHKGKNTPLSQLPVEVDCMCFAPETLVMLGDGTYKPIREIKKGDSVYTHRGRIRRVLGNVPRLVKQDENVYKIKVVGFLGELIATGNHPFYVLRGNEKCLCGCGQSLFEDGAGGFKTANRLFSPNLILSKKYRQGHWAKGTVLENDPGHFEWIKVDDFRPQEWFLLPWLEEGKISVDLAFARLLGYYAAEGHVPARSACVFLTLNTNEKETIAADILGLCAKLGYPAEIKNRSYKKQKWLSVIIRSRKLRDECLAHVGRGSNSKRFSPEIMGFDNAALKEIFIGAMLGDGWIYPSRGMKYISTSFALASQMSCILSRLGVRHSVSIHTEAKASKQRSYQVVVPGGGSADEVRKWLWPHLREKDKFSPGSGVFHCADYVRDEGQLKTLLKREKVEYTGEVYDLAVEEDESFIVHGVAVHNCPDYRYRWAWANHQKKAGPIGKNSLNQCISRAPRKTNPQGIPGLCKHILATRDFIYGLLYGFPEDMGPSDRLDRLTKHATKRWINFDAEMAAARERDAKIAAAKARRNIGLPPQRQNRLASKLAAVMPPELTGIPMEPWIRPPPSPQELKAKYGKAPAAPKAPQAPKGPKAPAPAPPPPGQRRRELPPAAPVKKIPIKPAKAAEKPAKKAAAPGEIKGLTPGQFLGRRFLKTEGVDSMTNMKTLLTLQEIKVVKNAYKLVVEMGDELGDELGGLDSAGDVGDMPSPSGADMPMEPPVSDSAVGASTQDNVAVGLLREIRDLLADLVADEAAEGGEAPEIPEEGELEPGEGGEEDKLAGEEEFRPGKRPMPVPSGAE